MKPTLSVFGERLCGRTAILDLMDNLGRAMAGHHDVLMMGGGNPGRVPELQALWRERMRTLLDDADRFDCTVGNYDPPAGNRAFTEAAASGLNRAFGWRLRPENIAVTQGGQTAFFYLFNLLAGAMPDGRFRRVLLPLSTEYIGYADQPLALKET